MRLRHLLGLGALALGLAGCATFCDPEINEYPLNYMDEVKFKVDDMGEKVEYHLQFMGTNFASGIPTATLVRLPYSPLTPDFMKGSVARPSEGDIVALHEGDIYDLRDFRGKLEDHLVVREINDKGTRDPTDDSIWFEVFDD